MRFTLYYRKLGVSAEQWMNDNEDIVKKYNELKKLSADLFKQDEMAVNARNQKFKNEIEKYRELINLRDKQIEQEVQMRTEVEKRLQKQRELVEEQKESEKLQKQLIKDFENYDHTQQTFSINSWVTNRRSQLNSKRSNRANELINEWMTKNNGKLTEENYSTVKGTIDKQLDREFGKKFTGLQVAADGLQLAGKVLKQAGTELLSLARTGISNQSNAYENSFTNISVRNRTTRSQYYGAQARVNNTLSSMGLRNNISTSQVQDMWNTLASEGIQIDLADQQTTTKAIETVLTNQIVPYLDMSSSYMQKLADDNPYIMKQVRGIGTSIQNVEGSNVVANEYLQDMMNSLTPMAELANQEIGVQYADALGQLENLRNQGFSDSQIGELYSTLKTMVEDPYKALTSGDTMTAIAASRMLASGGNLGDAGEWLRTYMYGFEDLANAFPEGNWASLYGGIAANTLGGPSASTWTTMNAKNISAYQSSQAGRRSSSGVNYAADLATSDFSSDRNQTNKTLQNITIENLMNELSVINEWMGNWSGVVVKAIEGIGNIIKTVIGVKLAGSLLGGGSGSGLLGKVGSSIKTGAGKVGTAAKTGLSAVGNGSMLAGVGNLASVAGGAYLGYQGFSNMASDISNGEFNLGTGLSTTQGIAGTTAAVAGGTAIGASLLGASGVAAAAGPIGWAALAVAGVAAAGKAIYDEVMENKKINESQLEEMNKQVDEEISQRKEKQREQISAYTELRDEIISTNDVETAKRELLEAGMLTQEEYNDAQINSKDKLMDLTDEYINSAQKLNEASNAIYSEIHKEQNKDMDPYIQKTKEFMNSIVKGAGQTKMYKQDDKGRSTTESTIRALYDYYSTADSLSEDEQKIFNKMSDYMGSAYSDLSWEEIDAIVNVMDNEKEAMRSSINKALKNTDILKRFTSGYGNSWTGDRVTEQLGLEKYKPMDTEKAQTALDNIASALINDTNTEIASETIRGYINDYKNATGHTDLNSLTGKTKEYITKAMEKYNIESYRQGINNVPADQLAMLHQGEAVLTASTANELRNMTDVYRETTSQTFNLDAIIQNQTSALIIKMDEIIRAITTGVSGTQSLTRNTADAKIWDSMIHMESTKAF